MNNKQYTPERITSLKPNEVFVFGSNNLGAHGKGAAKTAHEKFGAKQGVGEGMTGFCYAFPTVAKPGAEYRLSFDELCANMKRLIECVEKYPTKTFLLTKIGTNLAGISMEEMKKVFWSGYTGQKNLVYPIEFEK